MDHRSRHTENIVVVGRLPPPPVWRSDGTMNDDDDDPLYSTAWFDCPDAIVFPLFFTKMIIHTTLIRWCNEEFIHLVVTESLLPTVTWKPLREYEYRCGVFAARNSIQQSLNLKHYRKMKKREAPMHFELRGSRTAVVTGERNYDTESVRTIPQH